MRRTNYKARRRKEEQWGDRKLFLATFGAAIVLYLIWASLLVNAADWLPTVTNAGVLGDAFGVLNSFFSCLAFAGVVVSVVYTKRQLATQQAEIDAQTNAAAEQIARDQFFQMLNSWRNLTDQVTMGTTHGLTSFAEFARQLHPDLAMPHTSNEPISDLEKRKDRVEAAFDAAASTMQIHLGHYFRLLYHIVRFVHRSRAIKPLEKRDLIRIVRAHLSEPELLLLLYNCIHSNGKNLKPLAERYDLFDNLRSSRVARTIDMDFFPRTKSKWTREKRWPLPYRD